MERFLLHLVERFFSLIFLLVRFLFQLVEMIFTSIFFGERFLFQCIFLEVLFQYFLWGGFENSSSETIILWEIQNYLQTF